MQETISKLPASTSAVHRTLSQARLPLFWTVIAAAIAFPIVMQTIGHDYYIGFGSRVLIYALAATSLNLILGYGGMISFGHAAFVGAGAYATGIMMVSGMSSAFTIWPLAMLAAGTLALIIGAISLRTRGIYFIMITLAFAQMIYYLTVSMKSYGGDEGLTLPARPALPYVDFGDDRSIYYAVLLLLCTSILIINRIIGSRFGRVLQAIRENETRMQAIGYPTMRYKLTAFVIAGVFAGLAGALLAGQNSFVSPAMMHWTKSGTLMIMVIMGGVRHRYGGVVGALVLLGLEDVIANIRIDWLAELYPNYTQHSMLGVGIVLLIIVLYAPQGIAGLFNRRRLGND